MRNSLEGVILNRPPVVALKEPVEELDPVADHMMMMGDAAKPHRTVDFIFHPKKKILEDFKTQVTSFSLSGCWWKKGWKEGRALLAGLCSGE